MNKESLTLRQQEMPVTASDTSSRDATLLSPQTRTMLKAVGAAALLAVPLIARGRVVGALGLIRLAGSAPFTEVPKNTNVRVAVRYLPA